MPQSFSVVEACNVLSVVPVPGMRLAVIIPCFRVRAQILDVVRGAIAAADQVFVVDDCCSDHSGKHVAETFKEENVTVLWHDKNQGVGGATITGYKAALAAGHEVLIKVDGDGQMDTDYIEDLARPILNGEADYAKGNRFYRRDFINRMRTLRLLGNSVLSLISKASSGYWNIMDPTNGFTALHCVAAGEIELDNVSRRYFFEPDMLFRPLRRALRSMP